ncbi:hypothetical protein ABK040_006983 [Willaertia magna]
MFIDRTQDFHQILLSKHNQQTTFRKNVKKINQSSFVQSAKEIMNEIYTLRDDIYDFIKHSLRSSTYQSLDETYYQSLDLQLRECSKHIQVLQTLLDLDLNNKNLQQKAYFHSIIMFLYSLLENATKKLQFLKTIKTNKIKLFESPLEIEPITLQTVHIENISKINNESDNNALTEQQQLLLSSENHLLYEQLESYVKDARDTEKSAIQISELLTVFESKVNEQYELINQLHSNTEQATENVSEATNLLRENKEETFDKKNWFTKLLPNWLDHLLKYLLCYLFVCCGLILLMYDAVKF